MTILRCDRCGWHYLAYHGSCAFCRAHRGPREEGASPLSLLDDGIAVIEDRTFRKREDYGRATMHSGGGSATEAWAWSRAVDRGVTLLRMALQEAFAEVETAPEAGELLRFLRGHRFPPGLVEDESVESSLERLREQLIGWLEAGFPSEDSPAMWSI